MTRLSYIKALDRALEPLGFVRQGAKKDWIRTRGDISDWVNLQKSGIDGAVTVNLFGTDLETDRLLRSIPCKVLPWLRPITTRIGTLMDGRDRWWKNNPEGPAEVAAAVLTYGIPWFERIKSLEDEASLWFGRSATAAPWRKPNLSALAITLFRMGELDEALALYEAPPPKTYMERALPEGRCVQRWLQAKKAERGDG